MVKSTVESFGSREITLCAPSSEPYVDPLYILQFFSYFFSGSQVDHLLDIPSGPAFTLVTLGPQKLLTGKIVMLKVHNTT